jgi:hypothetical protein
MHYFLGKTQNQYIIKLMLMILMRLNIRKTDNKTTHFSQIKLAIRPVVCCLR